MSIKTNIVKDSISGVRKQEIAIPEIPESEDDIYLLSNPFVSLASLANRFYGDPKLWKVIAIANDFNSFYPPENVQIRIPINTEITFKRE